MGDKPQKDRQKNAIPTRRHADKKKAEKKNPKPIDWVEGLHNDK